jgi:RimJ/RimL family protein N-acetyltransferase
MTPEFRAQVTRILAAYHGLPADQIAQPGTILHPVGPDEWEDWLELALIGAGVGIKVQDALLDSVNAVRTSHPADHALTGADFVAAWGAEVTRIGHMLVYMLDRATFRRVVPDRRYTVRALTPADAAAFAAFQARCSEHDLNESDISVDHEAAYGVLDEDRIVAGASTYMWDGLVDVGVLTDPAYRGQGLGKAAVSAASAHYVDNPAEPRIVCYRHAASNLASQGIARSLGFSFYADFECVHRQTDRPAPGPNHP